MGWSDRHESALGEQRVLTPRPQGGELGTKIQTTGAVLAACLLFAACSGSADNDDGADLVDDQTGSVTPAPTEDPSPTLGGTLGTRAEPPSKEMDELEKPIALQLERKIEGDGLSLDYLDCPAWDGKAPQEMTCKGFLNGVTGDVLVALTRTTTRVNFDAELRDDVLATANLVRQLKSAGYSDVDCGDRPAYPSVVGSELVCAVGNGAEVKYVVATVRDDSGMVEIEDY